MDEFTRQEKLLNTFSTLADTLVADYDVIELLQTLVDSCHELLGAAEAGILLADSSGNLDVMASTSEASRLVETMQLGAEAGPGIESFTTGKIVAVPDIEDVPEAWSQFRDSALDLGFRSVHAFPLRLREKTIGTLNLLRQTTGDLQAQDAAAAKAFADVATIGILHERTMRELDTLADQLQTALNRRIAIEQAKGFIAHTRGIAVEDAFSIIRQYSRNNNIPLSQVAARIVDFTLELD